MQPIEDAIKQMKSESKTKEEIYSSLLSKKYSLKDIEKGFKNINLDKSFFSANFYLWILAGFGGIIVGLGAISLVAANWSYLSNEVKMIFFMSFMFLFYVLSFLADFKVKIRWLGEIFLLIGSLTFGANIFLVSQIYNLPIQWQDGFLYWFAGVSLLGAAKNSKLLYFISFVILFVGGGFLIEAYFFNFILSTSFAEGASYIALIMALISAVLISILLRKKAVFNFEDLLNLDSKS